MTLSCNNFLAFHIMHAELYYYYYYYYCYFYRGLLKNSLFVGKTRHCLQQRSCS